MRRHPKGHSATWFCSLPQDVQEFIDQYYHWRDGVSQGKEDDEDMSTDTEAAEAVYQLSMHCSTATSVLQSAIREVLAPATAARPGEEEEPPEYFYDSNDSVVDLGAMDPEGAQQEITLDDDATVPPWRPTEFG